MAMTQVCKRCGREYKFSGAGARARGFCSETCKHEYDKEEARYRKMQRENKKK